MVRLLHILPETVSLSKLMVRDDSYNEFELIQPKLDLRIAKFKVYGNYCGIGSSFRGASAVVNRIGSLPTRKADVYDIVGSKGFPHVQTLSIFPKEALVGKVVLVRFDSTILLLGEQSRSSSQLVSSAVYTIKYLLDLGAKVILASDWCKKINPKHLAEHSTIADLLSSILRRKVEVLHVLSSGTALKRKALEQADIFLLENLSAFKGEVANCLEFGELLSSGIDTYVNDAFSLSHKILASTISVTRFCHGCIGGFHFEECLYQLQNAVNANKRPFVSVIGSGNLGDKEPALKFLASRCDGLVFVGKMSFQIMHALGQAVPLNSLEHGANEVARDIIRLAHDRNIPIICPKDFWCVNNHLGSGSEIFPVHSIPDGWTPVDLGPSTLEELYSFLRDCKKVLWIGPMKFMHSSKNSKGASSIAQMLHKLSKSGSDITVIGNTACNAITKEASCASLVNTIGNASVAWEFLKGRRLPGVMALDRAYPYKILWRDVYRNPNQPLVVDIGSGNGLFIFGMAEKRKDLNFLGLEINGKLVKRCLKHVQESSIGNGFFIETNATSTFRSIVSSYPGKLVLVSIQCPNPDFNKPDHRWRMLQRSLVEAVTDLLAQDGNVTSLRKPDLVLVFLQSDVEAVALRLREEFLNYSKGKLVQMHNQDNTGINRPIWLGENPFGVRSDWEKHVLDRGKPMYRLTLTKTDGCVTQTQ